MLNIILSGAPGSGKGTQSDLLQKKYGFKHLSTGDLLREEIASGSEFGKRIDAIISKGNLVSDDIIMHLIERYFESVDDRAVGLIFDGFPRTLPQAEAFEQLLKERQEEALMINLVVDEQELVARMLNRGKTSGRSDDNIDVITKRLQVYHRQTEPLIGFYKSRNNYHTIDGSGSINNTFTQLDQLLAKWIR
ncbi:MAG: adenylate kinase [Paludibacteraceae bacterium]|nr:adenylate kinase [Paludibacteraceae bacterium]